MDPALFPRFVGTCPRTPGLCLLTSKGRASLLETYALPGSSAAADASSMGAGLAPAVPSRGTCLLPHRSMLCLNLVHPCRLCAVCVTVLVGVCTVPGHCSVAGASLSERAIRRCATRRPAVAFFLHSCASSAPFGLWHPWICGDLLCLHVLQGGVFLAPLVQCVFPCLHGLLWFCVVC